MSRARLLTLALVLVLSGCGGGDAGGGSAQEGSSSAGPSDSAVGDDVCASLRADGAGPADAFMVILFVDPADAADTARKQRALMDAPPPAEIRTAWGLWREFLGQAVRVASSGVDSGGLAGRLNSRQQALEPQRKQLEDWSFDHCA